MLSALSELGERPVPELAQAAGIREHSARYALDLIIKKKIVKPITYVNVRKMGYVAYSIFFSLVGGNEYDRSTFLQSLEASEYVSWVAEFVGEYQYAVTIYARHIDDFESFLYGLSSRSACQLSDKAIRLDFSFHYFPLKFFLTPGRKCMPIIWDKPSEGFLELDEIDHRMLVELTNQDYPSTATIARKIGIPTTTAHNRIERLKKQGVIVNFTYFFNAEKAGLHTYKCMLFTRGMDPLFREQFFEFAQKHPNVSLIVSCAGAWDYEVNFTLNDGARLQDCILDLYANLGSHITAIKTIQLIRHIKADAYPFKTFHKRQ
jgi:DNA-binding Lrp family transcriptional regulator